MITWVIDVIKIYYFAYCLIILIMYKAISDSFMFSRLAKVSNLNAGFVSSGV